MLPRYTYFLLITACLLLFNTQVIAQTNVWDKPDDNTRKALKKVEKGKKKVKQWKDHVKEWGIGDDYTQQVSLGAKLNTNGWSGSIYYMRKDEPSRKGIFQLSLSEIKHEKQVKQQEKNIYPELGTPSPFAFGKMNNLYTAQIGYGKEILLLPQVIDGNISIGLRWQVGFSLAMLKPYYLRMIYVDNTQVVPVPELKEQKYADMSSEVFLRTGNKLGASPWTKGLGEMKYIPGAFAELAAVIEPSSKGWFVQTITLGGNFAYYTKKLPIIAEVKAYPWQGSLFVGLALGKRW